MFQYLLRNGARADLIQKYRSNPPSFHSFHQIERIKDPLNVVINDTHLLQQMLGTTTSLPTPYRLRPRRLYQSPFCSALQ